MNINSANLKTSTPSTSHKPRGLSAIGVTLFCAILFAYWLHEHLGDFTAERGWRAGLQVAAISLAFGAMCHLIIEAAVRSVVGLQNELDALTAGRDRGAGSDEGS